MSALAYASRYFAQDQQRFPLATLVLLAAESEAPRRVRLLALAEQEAAERSRVYSIPSL